MGAAGLIRGATVRSEATVLALRPNRRLWPWALVLMTTLVLMACRGEAAEPSAQAVEPEPTGTADTGEREGDAGSAPGVSQPTQPQGTEPDAEATIDPLRQLPADTPASASAEDAAEEDDRVASTEPMRPPSTSIFRSEAHGFEFEHPQVCPARTVNETVNIGARISINVVEAAGEDLTQFARGETADFAVESFEDRGGAVPSVRVDYHFGGVNRFGSATFFQHTNRFIIVSFTAGGFECPNEPAVYDQVVSTLRFFE